MFSHHQHDHNPNKPSSSTKKRKLIKYVMPPKKAKGANNDGEHAAAALSQEQLTEIMAYMAANPPVNPSASEEKEVVTQDVLQNTMGQFAATMAESLGNFQTQVGQSMLGLQRKMEHNRASQAMFDQDSFKFLHNSWEDNKVALTYRILTFQEGGSEKQVERATEFLVMWKKNVKFQDTDSLEEAARAMKKAIKTSEWPEALKKSLKEGLMDPSKLTKPVKRKYERAWQPPATQYFQQPQHQQGYTPVAPPPQHFAQQQQPAGTYFNAQVQQQAPAGMPALPLPPPAATQVGYTHGVAAPKKEGHKATVVHNGLECDYCSRQGQVDPVRCFVVNPGARLSWKNRQTT